ncbi:MAG: SRPBCC family protein [Candidatus Pelagibacterales bacterium]|tara:strand:- start:1373 stop:2452 length:1080 start_codon:yes stop_codon:yes gene_type:complete
MNTQILKELIKQQRDGFTLDQAFYLDPDIFQLDYSNFFLNHWVFVDHVSSFKNIGDYFIFNLIADDIKVTKLENSIEARYISNDRICHSKIYEGLVFLNFSDNPDNFDEFIKPVQNFIELHDLSKAKVAYRKTYPTFGNWKLTLDNFHECYHCGPAHPEYCEVHSSEYIQAYGAGANTGPVSEKFKKELEAWNDKVKALGHFTGEYEEEDFSQYSRSAERTHLSDGKLSETRDGTPASILMGKFKDFDGGYTSVGPSPFNSLLMTNDFATIFKFIPRGPLHTDVELIWLVNKDAEEGKDYDIKKMVWMWDQTTMADKTIIENNQKGIFSNHYAPGKLSHMEVAVNSFKNWYLRHTENSL